MVVRVLTWVASSRVRRAPRAPSAAPDLRRQTRPPMISVSNTVTINPPGEPVVLTREDVWHGLMLKAENALPFVPAMTRCEVLERGDDTIVRTIEFSGHEIAERITFEPKRRVRFERTSGPVLGTILNEIDQDAEGNLELRFSFDLEIDGEAADGIEAHEYEATMTYDYLRAATATLAAVRRMITEDHPAAQVVG